MSQVAQSAKTHGETFDKIDLLRFRRKIADDLLRQWQIMHAHLKGAVGASRQFAEIDYVLGLQQLEVMIKKRKPELQDRFCILEKRLLVANDKDDPTGIAAAILLLNELATQVGVELGFESLCSMDSGTVVLSQIAALDESYMYRNLAKHLAGAGRWDELHELVGEGDGDHQQPWAQAKLRAEGSYARYVADVVVAWQEAYRRVQVPKSDGRQEAVLAQCIRYSLIVTSVNSQAGNYEPALVGRAVKTGLWTAAQALAVAAQVPEAEKRASMYRAILSAGGLTTEKRREAEEGSLAAVKAIGDRWSRADALAALAPQLTGEVRNEAVAEGLAAAEAIEAEWYR
ncbi:MAG: hypothetical protein WAV70_19050, partial [Anaerolineae bacterium]